MTRSGKTHSLLATARIANVPSVVSNVWLGVALAAMGGEVGNLWSAAVGLALAGIFIYVAGNFLNDWMDRGWDAENRPERALPRGLFSPPLYFRLAVGFGLLGVVLAAATSPAAGAVALGIVCAVVIYTVWHKRSPFAVIAMGLCRALLPVMGAAGVGADFSPLSLVLACALGLFCHIAGLSLSARTESMAHPPAGVSWLAKILFGIALAATGYVGWWHSGAWYLALAGGLPYAIWISLSLSVWRRPVPVHVSRLLAGIPLVDWVVLLPLALALGFAWDPFVIGCFVIPPLAFVLALLLQRVAPAT